jgi:hypothetical protein
MLATMTSSPDITNQVILKCQDQVSFYFGSFWRLCHTHYTSLTISEEEIKEGCTIILEVMDEV